MDEQLASDLGSRPCLRTGPHHLIRQTGWESMPLLSCPGALAGVRRCHTFTFHPLQRLLCATLPQHACLVATGDDADDNGSNISIVKDDVHRLV